MLSLWYVFSIATELDIWHTPFPGKSTRFSHLKRKSIKHYYKTMVCVVRRGTKALNWRAKPFHLSNLNILQINVDDWSIVEKSVCGENLFSLFLFHLYKNLDETSVLDCVELILYKMWLIQWCVNFMWALLNNHIQYISHLMELCMWIYC